MSETPAPLHLSVSSFGRNFSLIIHPLPAPRKHLRPRITAKTFILFTISDARPQIQKRKITVISIIIVFVKPICPWGRETTNPVHRYDRCRVFVSFTDHTPVVRHHRPSKINEIRHRFRRKSENEQCGQNKQIFPIVIFDVVRNTPSH